MRHRATPTETGEGGGREARFADSLPDEKARGAYVPLNTRAMAQSLGLGSTGDPSLLQTMPGSRATRMRPVTGVRWPGSCSLVASNSLCLTMFLWERGASRAGCPCSLTAWIIPNPPGRKGDARETLA